MKVLVSFFTTEMFKRMMFFRKNTTLQCLCLLALLLTVQSCGGLQGDKKAKRATESAKTTARKFLDALKQREYNEAISLIDRPSRPTAIAEWTILLRGIDKQFGGLQSYELENAKVAQFNVADPENPTYNDLQLSYSSQRAGIPDAAQEKLFLERESQEAPYRVIRYDVSGSGETVKAEL